MATNLPGVSLRLNSPESFLAGADSDWILLQASDIFTTSYQNSLTVAIAYAANILIAIEYNYGSLTTADIDIQFSDDGEAPWLTFAHADLIGGSDIALINHSVFRLGAADLDFCISIPNPGARKMRVRYKGNGTITNSSIIIRVMRGNGGKISWNAGS